ncbi:hypothetical protein OG607_25090 [Streptomyces sp. NBC_01537]|uniref:hypothetical protein n=1 Tax=Streptomyces sp. NBC_01537 TaxID=2903896 RepID=UPI00386DAF52
MGDEERGVQRGGRCGGGAEPKRGPLAHGFSDDQRRTLGRIKTLIGRLFCPSLFEVDYLTVERAEIYVGWSRHWVVVWLWFLS